VKKFLLSWFFKARKFVKSFLDLFLTTTRPPPPKQEAGPFPGRSPITPMGQVPEEVWEDMVVSVNVTTVPPSSEEESKQIKGILSIAEFNESIVLHTEEWKDTYSSSNKVDLFEKTQMVLRLQEMADIINHFDDYELN
jgi:hypothetical protein